MRLKLHNEQIQIVLLLVRVVQTSSHWWLLVSVHRLLRIGGLDEAESLELNSLDHGSVGLAIPQVTLVNLVQLAVELRVILLIYLLLANALLIDLIPLILVNEEGEKTASTLHMLLYQGLAIIELTRWVTTVGARMIRMSLSS
jgi:hypothetical protein